MNARDELGRLTRLAAYGVIRRGDTTLLCRVSAGYPAAGEWTLPGGGIEFGEAPETAAVREVEEETGLIARVTSAPRILSHTGIWPARVGRPQPVTYHQIRFIYPMEVVGGSERVEVGGSTDAFGWFTQSEAATLRIVGLVALALDLPMPAGDDEVASPTATP